MMSSKTMYRKGGVIIEDCEEIAMQRTSSDEVKCTDCGFAHHVSNPDSIVKCESCDEVLCKSFSGRDESGPYGCGTPASLEDMLAFRIREFVVIVLKEISILKRCIVL